jgi:hypothetical protein
MKHDFETKFTGLALIIGALFLLIAWVFLPHHIGEYFEPTDFAAINENFRLWVWGSIECTFSEGLLWVLA